MTTFSILLYNNSVSIVSLRTGEDNTDASTSNAHRADVLRSSPRKAAAINIANQNSDDSKDKHLREQEGESLFGLKIVKPAQG